MSYTYDEAKLINTINAGRIDSIQKLRLFPELDAGLIRFVIGPIGKNTTVKEYVPKDPSVCESNNCEVWKRLKSLNELPDDMYAIPDAAPDLSLSVAQTIESYRQKCASCPHAFCRKTYINPRQKYNLYNRFRNRINRPTIRLTKLHYKLLLILQSWPSGLIEKKGSYDAVMNNVYVPDLAKILKCNADYLEDCLKDLGNMDIVDLEKISAHFYNVILKGYYQKFLKASEGGTGYIQINRDILSNLINEKNILSLRGKLYQLLNNPLYDSARADKSNIVTVSEIRTFMPKYVNYKAQFDRAFNNDLFVMMYDKRTNKIFYKLKSDIATIKELKADILEKNIGLLSCALKAINPTFINKENTSHNIMDNGIMKLIDSIINKSKNSLPSEITNKDSSFKFFKDVLLLSLEYSVSNITAAILQIEQVTKTAKILVKNAGALLRTQCCYNLLNGIT